jgi:SAM-dependent methyltransferase
MPRADVPSPWLQVTAHDYEAHMEEIGQSAALRAIFSRVYGRTRPRRLLVLGCTTGRDLALVDPAVTELSVGVDVSSDYLALARARLGQNRPTSTLVHGDVLEVELPVTGFDLIHAALLLEHVDPERLFARIPGWLAAEGVCVTVTQEPVPGVEAVSRTGRASLCALEGRMVLHTIDELRGLAARAGLHLLESSSVALPLGKSFTVCAWSGPSAKGGRADAP